MDKAYITADDVKGLLFKVQENGGAMTIGEFDNLFAEVASGSPSEDEGKFLNIGDIVSLVAMFDSGGSVYIGDIEFEDSESLWSPSEFVKGSPTRTAFEELRDLIRDWRDRNAS